MTWKVIRNEEKEIIRRELTPNIYIDRRCCGSFRADYWDNVLVIDGEDRLYANTYTGYTVKDLKEMGEKHMAKIEY